MREQRQTVRFGPFEADLTAGELRRDGQRVRLQQQPFRLLERCSNIRVSWSRGRTCAARCGPTARSFLSSAD